MNGPRSLSHRSTRRDLPWGCFWAALILCVPVFADETKPKAPRPGAVEVRLIGTRSNRNSIGARLRIVSSGITQVQEAKGGMSYQSAHDPRLHFGLGTAIDVTSLEVQWPSGTVTTLAHVPANRCITVREDAQHRSTAR